MTLDIFYKGYSGNDNFRTHEDRQSIYLRKLEDEYPGYFLTMEEAAFSLKNTEFYNTETATESYVPMYAVTTLRRNGAVAIFFPGAMERIAKKLGGDYYVFPSSVDEVIVAPVDRFNPEGIVDITKEINDECVDLDMRLDNRVFYYNAATKTFSPLEEKDV